MRFRFLVSVAAALCILASVEASADLAGVRVASVSGGLRGHEHDQRTSDAAAATLAEGDALAAGAIGSIVLNPAAAEDDGGGGSREGLERGNAPGEGRRPTRALLQDPFILQPPVPINWWIFGDAPLVPATLSPASQPSFNDETACVALIRALVMREEDDASGCDKVVIDSPM